MERQEASISAESKTHNKLLVLLIPLLLAVITFDRPLDYNSDYYLTNSLVDFLIKLGFYCLVAVAFLRIFQRKLYSNLTCIKTNEFIKGSEEQTEIDPQQIYKKGQLEYPFNALTEFKRGFMIYWGFLAGAFVTAVIVYSLFALGLLSLIMLIAGYGTNRYYETKNEVTVTPYIDR